MTDEFHEHFIAKEPCQNIGDFSESVQHHGDVKRNLKGHYFSGRTKTMKAYEENELFLPPPLHVPLVSLNTVLANTLA